MVTSQFLDHDSVMIVEGVKVDSESPLVAIGEPLMVNTCNYMWKWFRNISSMMFDLSKSSMDGMISVEIGSAHIARS